MCYWNETAEHTVDWAEAAWAIYSSDGDRSQAARVGASSDSEQDGKTNKQLNHLMLNKSSKETRSDV